MPVCVVGAEAGAPGAFEAFQIIAERNIFSPKASGRAAESAKPSEPTGDSLVLAGTMSYAKGQFAFFDGSNPDFRKVLKVGENIGGCVLAEVASKQVKLKAGELEFELAVGTRLIRENAGQWKLGGKAEGISAPAEAVLQRIRVPESKHSESKHSGMAAKEGKGFEADPDKYSRWAEKKISKYPGRSGSGDQEREAWEEDSRSSVKVKHAKRLGEEDHRSLALWAVDCAEHVLHLFEEKHPKDNRPRKAIEAARAWARGEIRCGAARAAALAAHAAARDADEAAARAAARAAGHAAATAHAAVHARAAAAYAVTAVDTTAAAAAAAASARERDWQRRRLPKRLRGPVFLRRGA